MIAAIELAINARLKAMEPMLGFAWARNDVLPDDWEKYLDSLTGELRGCTSWVGFTGWSNAERIYTDEGEQLVVDGTFGLLLGTTTARQEPVFARHGGPDPAKEPGAYRLITAATALLAGQMLGLDLVEPIEVGDCQPLPRSARMKQLKLTAHALMLTCRFPILIAGEDALDPVGDAVLLERIHANWDVPEYGSPFPIDADLVAPDVQLPDDAHADANDTIILQEPEE